MINQVAERQDRRYPTRAKSNQQIARSMRLIAFGWIVFTCCLQLATADLSVVAAQESVPSQSDQQLNRDAYNALKTYCYRCHGTSQKLPDFDVLDHESLTKSRDDGGESIRYVTPGDIDASAMWEYIEGEGNYMPMDGSPEAASMTNEDRELIKRWIISGATFPEQTARPFRSRVDDLLAIREQLTQAEPNSRRHLRFFTFSHLANNNRRVTDFDLQMVKAALSKLLNSLSWQSTIVLPREVQGSDGTVFFIDLRDLGWSGGREWLQIVDHDPYGLSFHHVPDSDTKQLAAELEQLSGAQSPVVRADWFIFAASRPPLYHDLLQLPTRIEDLERLVGVDTLENIKQGDAARAGFGRSGVSRQNRMVERHESDFGAYWVSYDFLPRRGRGDLIRFPLGPRFEGNDFNRHAFDHDGGEAVFNLPNGLQGYYLLTAEGDRIDGAAPADVVFDSAAIAGTPAIINGVSCMNCHREGMVTGFTDEIRNSDALAGAAAQRVRSLYVEPAEMDKLIDADKRRFMNSLEKAIGPFLLVDQHQSKTVDQFPDPIGRVVQRYLADLGPDEIALELGLENIQRIEAPIKHNRDLRKLGLGTLVQDQPGTIKRARWEAVDGTSFYQDVAMELGLGTPILPGSSSIPQRPFDLRRHPSQRTSTSRAIPARPVIPTLPNDQRTVTTREKP
ncbi:MAG: c-type cytochrome domain-containing protein [Planctomycetota bacterium]